MVEGRLRLFMDNMEDRGFLGRSVAHPEHGRSPMTGIDSASENGVPFKGMVEQPLRYSIVMKSYHELDMGVQPC